MAGRVVFLHGGLHTSRCWDETVAAITALRPDVATLAVDLPGRQRIPADLATLTIDACAAAVVRQINDGGLHGDEPVTLVGHSLAGVILPEVVTRLPLDRVAQVVFLACCVPAPGQCVMDTLPVGLRPIVRHLAKRSPVVDQPPSGLLRYAFGNRTTVKQRHKIGANIVPESSALLTERPTASLPTSVRRSWISTKHDRALPPIKQREFIENLGGVTDLVTINAGHEVMITHPTELATALIQLMPAHRLMP